MKFLALTILLALAAPLSTARAQGPSMGGKEGVAAQRVVERKIDAAPDATVSLCLGAGSVVVRGWDRGEVQARSAQAERLELRATQAGPSRKGIEVVVSDDAEGRGRPCYAASDVELDVPRGATVHVRVIEGDVDVSGVAEARIESLNGDVDARRVTRAADVACLSGDVSLADSKGRLRLRSVSGSVDVMNVMPAAAGDELEVHSTSGDLTLERVGHASVKGATTSGSVRMSGPLARGGVYDLATHSGDVTLALPADASFRVNARVVFSGEIITDFPLTANLKPTSAADPPDPPDPPGPGKGKVKVKTKHPHPPMPPHQMTLVGTVGKGNADLKLTSFSGTVYLKKE